MVNYVIVRKSSKGAEPIEKSSYGICACSFCDGIFEIKDCIYDISDDAAWLKSLTDKLNLYGVDPIHLCDIIEDELYKVGT